MTFIIYTLITIILIFITSELYIIFLITGLIITNYYIFNNKFKKFAIKSISIFPFYFTLIVLYSFFYGNGKIYYLYGIKIYFQGFIIGIDLFIRCFLITLFIFSLNLMNKAGYILKSISHALSKISLARRLLTILFLSLYFIEMFIHKFTSKTKIRKIRNFTTFVKNSLLEVETDIMKVKEKIKELSMENKSYRVNYILIWVVSIIFAINIFVGGFFEKLF